MCHLDIQKHVSYKKWYKYYKCFVCRLIQMFSNSMGENFRRILTHLYFIKFNEINICHSYIQKHVSRKKWFK